MSKYSELEKRIEQLEITVGMMMMDKEKLQKIDEPEIVYGSTVSVRDQKIKKLFDEVLSDFREAIAQSVEGGDEVMVKLALNALDSDFDKVREKLNKILGGE